MRLKSFQIKNYQSALDTDIVELSKNDNVTILAGQNESGKSSVLRALYDYERDEFSEDSRTFSVDNKDLPQEIICTYSVESEDNLASEINKSTIEIQKIKVGEDVFVLDESKLQRIKEFTITRSNSTEGVKLSIDQNAFKIFRSAILDKPLPAVPEGAPVDAVPVPTKYLEIADDDNDTVANIFWRIAPPIVFFDDFCDLLPDKIFIADLKDKKKDTKGYRAVRNLEKILGTRFDEKDIEVDAVRRTKETKENNDLTINFQADWGQRIHGENQVIVKYNFEKRNGEAENGSYINFFVETKEGQPLSPRQRSKGLIWFLSLWMELKAQNLDNGHLILLLDEPDQHLHVKAQKDVLKLINKLASEKDMVIYSTHSPYLIEVEHLNRIKLIVNDKDQGTLIEGITTSKIDSENKKDALQPIIDAIGMNVSEFSPMSTKNVILEGISDFYYFTAMKKLLNKTGNYSFIPGVGVRKVDNLISLCIGYGLQWCAVIDDDPEAGGTDSLTKFNEIKEHIFDGDETETKKKVHVLKGTMGIENMFTFDDLKLIDPKIQQNQNKTEAVGKGRKVTFSRNFFEKVQSGEITEDKISKTSKTNFDKAFNFIESALKS